MLTVETVDGCSFNDIAYIYPRARTGWESLTHSELTVVHVIAEGATNRSVAQQLHLSPHTVKTHLRNAFAKLGITSRAQLAQLMRCAD